MPEQREHDRVDDQGCHEGAGGGVPPDEPPRDSRKTETDAEQDKQIQKLNRRVIFAWIFGPGLGLIAVAFTGLQWKSSDEQVAIMRQQLQGERPRLTVQQVTNEPDVPTAGQRFRVKVRIVNVGRLPAEQVMWSMRLELVSGTGDPEPVPPFFTGFRVLGPGDSTEVSVPLTTKFNEPLGMLSPKLVSGTATLYVHGRVRYQWLDETIEFPFCRMFTPRELVNHASPGEWSVSLCETQLRIGQPFSPPE